jgi:3-oxoacyl-[acyl-carrier protein] reductase
MATEKPGIWVTGASSGIGKEAAKEFARVGCNVYATARRITELERLKSELEKEKLDILTYPCNVASAANVDQTVKKILAAGNIHCLINNAGITSYKAAEDNSVQEINDIINTNLLGAVYCIKYVLPQMIKRQSGVIINVLSTAVINTFTESSAYTASKTGLLGYTNVLREEVRKYNIRVVNVIPGATETPMWSQEIRKDRGERMMTPDEVARIMVSIFLQKGNLVTEEIVLRPILGNL